jgi:general secretion pathway protein G
MLLNKGVKMKIKKDQGFTLIEIMLVLALLGVVMSIVVPKLGGVFGRGQTKATKLQLKQIQQSLDRFKMDCRFYPTGEQGLKALFEKPTSGRTCSDYDPEGYLGGSKKIPRDAWGTEYTYSSDDGASYILKSLGADGAEGGEGNNADISSEDEE